MNDFWQYTAWYVLLGLTSAIALTAIFVKSQYRKFHFAFWLAVLGFTYMLEVILLFWLHAYSYAPHIVSDRFSDSVMGNFFSQFSVSSSAVLLCVLGLHNRWRFAFAAVYYLIDVLFSSLGLYIHNWYQSIFTLFGYVGYSFLVHLWHKYLTNINRFKLLNGATLFLAVFAAAGNSLLTVFNFAGLQILSPSVFAEYAKDHLLGMLAYGPMLILIMMLLRRLSRNALIHAAVILALGLIQYGLYLSGFIWIKENFFLLVTVLDILGYYFWTLILNRCLASPAH